MTNPQEEVYKEYLNYDWEAFTEFQTGLEEILSNYLDNLKEQDPAVTSIPALDRQQLVNQAKCFFYCSNSGNILNLDDFEDWKIHNEDKYKKSRKVEELADEEVKKVEEKVEQASSDPPYSSNYQELVELIVAGKPIPGIKNIPDTVLSDAKSKPEGKQRVKPWERNKESASDEFV